MGSWLHLRLFFSELMMKNLGIKLASACPIDASGHITCLIVASSGFSQSPGLFLFGNVHSIKLVHHHDHWNGQQKMVSFCWHFFRVTLAAAGAIRSKYLLNSGIKWLLLKPWTYAIGQCAQCHTGASARPSKWQVTINLTIENSPSNT
jgi:hypothetical protein